MWNGETKMLGSGRLWLKVIRVPVSQHRLLKFCFQPSIPEVNQFEPEQPEALAINAHWNPLAYLGTLNREGTKECSEVIRGALQRIVMIPNHPKYPLIASFASFPTWASHGESSSLKDISTSDTHVCIYIYVNIFNEIETNPPIFVPIDFLKQNANWNS